MTRAAAALAWDGARVPAGRLPAKARAFLGQVTPPKKLAARLAAGGALELRICWVPRLRGGADVLVPSFQPPGEKRLGFRTTRTLTFGPVLGVVYRR